MFISTDISSCDHNILFSLNKMYALNHVAVQYENVVLQGLVKIWCINNISQIMGSRRMRIVRSNVFYMCCVLYQWVCIIYYFTASKSQHQTVSTARKILNYLTGSQPSTKSSPVIAGANKDIIQTAEGISITIKRGSIPDEQVLFYIYM